jgi:ADP-heptose:LPS heptosyltransferase
VKSANWVGIARLGGVGDDLLAASVARPFKKMGYNVDMLTGEGNHVVYYNNPNIDKVSVKRDGDLPKNNQELWLAWFQSRAAEYDQFVHLSHSMEMRHALFPSMTAFWWPQEYRRKLCGGSYLETVHDIANVPYDFGPLFYASAEEKDRAVETKKKVGPRVIGWVLAGSRLDKIYPYSPHVIARIIKEFNAPILLIGAPNEKQLACAKAIQETVMQTNSTLDGLHLAMTTSGNVAGAEKAESADWPIRRSLAQLQACDLVITPDTGLAWGVAFEPMPKIVTVSHASEQNITKHWLNCTTLHADPARVPCWPCHRLHNDISTCVKAKDAEAAACMADISVEDLMQNVKKLWTEQGRPGLRAVA